MAKHRMGSFGRREKAKSFCDRVGLKQFDHNLEYWVNINQNIGPEIMEYADEGLLRNELRLQRGLQQLGSIESNSKFYLLIVIAAIMSLLAMFSCVLLAWVVCYTYKKTSRRYATTNLGLSMTEATDSRTTTKHEPF